MTLDGLLPDVGPAISRLAMVVHKSLFTPGAEAMKEAYANLIRGLPDGLELIILIDAHQMEVVTAWLAAIAPKCRPEIVTAAGDEISVSTAWIRDEFLCRHCDGRISHIETASAKSGRFGQLLAAANHAAFDKRIVALDGGDCLVTRDRWIVGAQAVWNTASIVGHETEFDTALSRIAALHPSPPVVAGFRLAAIKSERLRTEMRNTLTRTPTQCDLIQAWEHIDLVVAATGIRRNDREVLLVASTTLGGDSKDEALLLEGDKLDALADHLAQEGFCIIRNPTPFIDRSLFHYNNVIVQNDPNIVWLPLFSDARDSFASDEENIRIWESLGFKVIPIGGWRAFVGKAGAIRCATKTLARGGLRT